MPIKDKELAINWVQPFDVWGNFLLRRRRERDRKRRMMMLVDTTQNKNK